MPPLPYSNPKSTVRRKSFWSFGNWAKNMLPSSNSAAQTTKRGKKNVMENYPIIRIGSSISTNKVWKMIWCILRIRWSLNFFTESYAHRTDTMLCVENAMKQFYQTKSWTTQKQVNKWMSVCVWVRHLTNIWSKRKSLIFNFHTYCLMFAFATVTSHADKYTSKQAGRQALVFLMPMSLISWWVCTHTHAHTLLCSGTHFSVMILRFHIKYLSCHRTYVRCFVFFLFVCIFSAFFSTALIVASQEMWVRSTFNSIIRICKCRLFHH